ncbi:hypothetical protein NQ315_012447 [Exocentrus adspersus]|uniref:UvrD-like helicase C-terminal domain-containing protein n=1 Tax=Exocentrus adspersus TaxID=1586481 RepID=A0AAV8VMW5_9CUCU|nr:hypothetical protein NQ315_012447 [Exocentrus adspersus]
MNFSRGMKNLSRRKSTSLWIKTDIDEKLMEMDNGKACEKIDCLSDDEDDDEVLIVDNNKQVVIQSNQVEVIAPGQNKYPVPWHIVEDIDELSFPKIFGGHQKHLISTARAFLILIGLNPKQGGQIEGSVKQPEFYIWLNKNLNVHVRLQLTCVYEKMAPLTEEERVSLLMMYGWGDRRRTYDEVVELFNETFRVGVTGISKSTVSKTIKRFDDTGTNKNRPKRKILKIIKFHPYKIHLHHQINEDDPDRRLEFCENMMERIAQNHNYSSFIVFSDESTFQLNESDYFTAIRISVKKPTVFLKRNSLELVINNYNEDILNLFEANMDIQFILDPYSCASYIINYVSKVDSGLSKMLREAASDAQNGNVDIKQRLHKVANVFLNGNVMSAQEASYHILSMPFSKSSRGTVYVDTSPINERVRMLKSESLLKDLPKDSNDIFLQNKHEKYAARPKKLINTCLADFADELTEVENVGHKEKYEKYYKIINENRQKYSIVEQEEIENILCQVQNDLQYVEDEEVKNFRKEKLSEHDEIDIIDQMSYGEKKHTAFALPFGQFGVVGDLKQIPPVLDKYVFESSSSTDLTVLVDSPLWSEFYYFQLTQVMRQKNELAFIEALNNLAEGTMTDSDIKLIQSRIVNESDVPDTAIRLYYTNQDVDNYNFEKIKNFPGDVYTVVAEDIVLSKKTDDSKKSILTHLQSKQVRDTGGLPYSLGFKIGIKYMTTTNLDVEDGLVNGACGILRHITFSENQNVKIVWLEFLEKRVGKKKLNGYNDFINKNKIPLDLIPIERHSLPLSSISNNLNCEIIRKQFPLIPAEAITIHKSQGQTYNEVCLDLRKKNRMKRSLLYVGLSRVTNLAGSFNPPKPPKDDDPVFVEIERLKREKSLKTFDHSLGTFDLKITYLNKPIQLVVITTIH